MEGNIVLHAFLLIDFLLLFCLLKILMLNMNMYSKTWENPAFLRIQHFFYGFLIGFLGFAHTSL